MKWSVLTLVGADQPGIVAAVSDALYQQGCNLGQASMLRLGANFAIMLRVSHAEDVDLRALLSPVIEAMQLHVHIDADEPMSEPVPEPDVRLAVYGADRSGIVAQVTAALRGAGLNILDLETQVGGKPSQPIYVMTLEGVATQGIEMVKQVLEPLQGEIDIRVQALDTLRG